MFVWKQSISVYLVVLTWNSTFGWRWKTTDAIIQDVRHQRENAQFKRASSVSTTANVLPLPQTSTAAREIASEADLDDDESILVFEGRYFKPNEVPPPPPFMMTNSNWHGGSSSRIKQKQPKAKNSYFYYLTTVGTASKLHPIPPVIQKFTEENAKDITKTEIVQKEKARADEKISSSNSKTVIASTSVPHLENLHYYEELAATEEEFQEAPKCFTATDTEGRCVPFKQCYPVVFNVIDGDLRNPGLAKLLYQSSGPCNATLELDFVLNKKKNEKSFLDVQFYNQSICCPKFKHPPTMLSVRDDEIRSARLINSDKQSPKNYSATTIAAEVTENETHAYIVGENEGTKSRPLQADDSSVEMENPLNEYITSNENGEMELILGDEEEIEDEHIRIAVGSDIERQNSTVEFARVENAEDDGIVVEERRGDRHKGNKNKPDDAFLSIPAPNLSPNKCRHQIYGMPRGHWPWMVALVIRSRHICSGVLIDERHIVTAAHCVYLLDDAEMRKLRIIIGDRVMYSAVDGPHFWRKVTKIITHVNYNQQTFASDIAILKMNSDVPFSRNVQPISLPDLVSSVDINTIGKGIVAGWSGADIGQPSFEARTETETAVVIMDKAECEDIYRGFALSGVAKNTFCTKAANNTCVADSGAPLIVRVENCWVAVGLFSWGLGCSHFPEVYVDVTRFTSWIRKHAV